MWLLTPIGFFSVVQKPGDSAAGTLTVRARVRDDLEALQAQFLPTLGVIEEGRGTDYRFRARVPRADLASAMAAMIAAIDYDNFKNRVARTQGAKRAGLYHNVWDVLSRLEAGPGRTK